MSYWTDVRLVPEDVPRAIGALLRELGSLSFEVDVAPPASGPEWELRVRGYRETRVWPTLARARVEVLSSRERRG